MQPQRGKINATSTNPALTKILDFFDSRIYRIFKIWGVSSKLLLLFIFKNVSLFRDTVFDVSA